MLGGNLFRTVYFNQQITDPSFLDTTLKFTSVGTVVETLSAQFQVGTNYSFSFFVGTPAGSSTPGTVQATLLESNQNGPYDTDSILHNPLDVTTVPIPIGSMTLVTVVWTAADIANGSNAQNGNRIGIQLRVDGFCCNLKQEVDFLVPSAVPLPGALPLFVSGLGGLGLLAWCKSISSAHWRRPPWGAAFLFVLQPARRTIRARKTSKK